MKLFENNKIIYLYSRDINPQQEIVIVFLFKGKLNIACRLITPFRNILRVVLRKICYYAQQQQNILTVLFETQ